MATNLRIVYVTCALLAITIGSFANEPAVLKTHADSLATQNGTVQQSNNASKNSINIEETTTAIPMTASSTNIPAVKDTSAAIAHPKELPTTAVATEKSVTQPTAKTAEASSEKSTKTIIASTPKAKDTTTSQTIITDKPDKTDKTTAMTTAGTTEKPSEKSTESTTEKSTIAQGTTAVSSTAAPVTPSAKERHFDGLSFLGGIVLAVSLMAIAALSWKFYRTNSEQQHYRTL